MIRTEIQKRHKRQGVVIRGAALAVVAAFGLSLAAPVAASAAPSRLTNQDKVVTSGEVRQALQNTTGVLDTSSQAKVTTDSDSALKTAAAGATVDIPKDAKKGVTLTGRDGAGLSVGLPNATTAGAAQQVANGVISYPSTSGAANAVQANADGSVRMLTVIDNPSAPTRYDYNISLPTGGSLHPMKDGSVTVRDAAHNPIAVVAAPWARDAKGNAVTTRYTVHGGTLMQHINHTAPGVQYPVTADPQVSFGWYIYVKLSPRDQLFILQQGPSVVAGFICAAISKNPYVVAACAVGGNTIKDWIATYYSSNRWVEVKFTYQGWFAGIKRL